MLLKNIRYGSRVSVLSRRAGLEKGSKYVLTSEVILAKVCLCSIIYKKPPELFFFFFFAYEYK